MGTILDHHPASAQIAFLIADLIRNGHLRQLLFRQLHGRVQIRIEIGYHSLPFDAALFHGIQQSFHAGGKMHIHDRGECLFHHMIHNFSKFRHIEIFFFFHHIASGQDGSDGRRIGTGAPDPKLLQGPHQSRLVIMGRRLGEMLPGVKRPKRKDAVLSKAHGQGILLFILIGRIVYA